MKENKLEVRGVLNIVGSKTNDEKIKDTL